MLGVCNGTDARNLQLQDAVGVIAALRYYRTAATNNWRRQQQDIDTKQRVLNAFLTLSSS